MICFSVALFVATIRFGALPDSRLDASWTEVIAWAALNHAQWGRDIAFTYGPLGFLHGNSSYVPGILGRFVVGQVLLTAAFVAMTVIMLTRARGATYFLFAVAYVCAYVWIPSDVSWAITLLFGTTVLINRANDLSAMTYAAAVAAVALVFGAIAWIKFSLLLLWILCVAALIGVSLLGRLPRRALVLLLFFAAALLVMWVACGQGLAGLPGYLHAGLEISLGYGHAMGREAPLIVDLVGATCLGSFCSIALVAAHHARRDAPTRVASVLCMAAAFLAWRANFTRPDHAHWFFAFMSLLPFVLLSHGGLAEMKRVRHWLILFTLVCAAAGLFGPDELSARLPRIIREFNEHLRALIDPSVLETRRAAQWATEQQRESLDTIRKRVGAATVDMFTHEQGVVLLNGLNYSPRPVFQSYAAYTPYLARLNEEKILGAHAPEFVVMQLAAIDGRLPMGEDSLALLALLQRYRPAGMERGYLLLQQDAEVAPPAQMLPPSTWNSAALGENIVIPESPETAIIAFLDLDLSPLGKVYTALLREPPLRIVIETDRGEYSYRFIRASGSSGFVVSPLIRTTQDWENAQTSSPLPRVRSFRVEPQSAGQDIFFRHEFAVGFQQRDYLHVDSKRTPARFPVPEGPSR